MCHIIGIEPQFENIIKNGPFIPVIAGQRKPEGQWIGDERKAANLDQRLKSLIIIYETGKSKSLVSATPLSTAFISTSIVQDFQDSPDDEGDTRSSHFARDCWSKTLVPSYQSPFQPKLLSSSQHKPELRPTKDFEAKYNKVKTKLALLSSSASAFKAGTVKNKGLIAEAYEWDEEEVPSDDNEMVEVKVLMPLAEENDAVSKESATNGEWVKISMRKYDIRKPIWYLDGGCSRHMTGVKSYLHIYEEQPGPKVAFGDDSTCTTEGYGSIKCNGIVFTKGLESVSIRRIQGVGYGVLEFLGVGTTFDIFQNILFPYSLNTAYCLSWIRRIGLVSFVVFGECRHRYVVSSLMDMAYWLSEQ
ncbi:hypothetical protein Tco_1045719 [Tanacetum coccineum]|uniref:Retrovirus-related Pol polyprotein from transposon TNT 1-94-like beta-barrel domain-containing protein n=1 Tax=Tanacetum coccineum TaxID=301880 RepID=A0ABQ5GUL8_9ASTR